MKFFKREFKPTIPEGAAIAAADTQRIVNVNTIATSIEKANKTLQICKKNQNVEAIATWERIIAALQSNWRNAMIEVQTKGNYSFE